MVSGVENQRQQYPHEVLNNTVEFGPLVAETELSAVLFDAGCQGAEVLHGFGNSLKYDIFAFNRESRGGRTHSAIKTHGD
jgi:hypothetical protein